MPETVVMNVGVVTYLGHDGASIFSGECSEGRRVRVVASSKSLSRHPVVGETWQILGDYREHPKYGRQFHAARGTCAIPKGRLIINFLSNNPDFVGIGEAKAKALYAAFGDGLADILNSGDVEALWTVLSGAIAERLVVVWAEKREEGAVVAFLDQHGFDVRIANKLRRVWGSQAIEMLERNPYYMLAFASCRRAFKFDHLSALNFDQV